MKAIGGSIVAVLALVVVALVFLYRRTTSGSAAEHTAAAQNGRPTMATTTASLRPAPRPAPSEGDASTVVSLVSSGVDALDSADDILGNLGGLFG